MKHHKTTQATVAHPSSNLLGEGPVWHEARKSFFWVDIEGKCFHEIKWPEKKVSTWPVAQRIGMLVPENDNHLIIALQDGIAKFNLDTSQVQWLTYLEKEMESNRPNDGKCDASGRLWLGTMDVDCRDHAGSLYCIDHNISVKKKLSRLSVSNGLAWSHDNKRLYFIDSPTNKVDSYLFNLETGEIIFEKTAIRIPSDMGMPDGMCIDIEGMLWVANWDGFSICRWDPGTGGLLETISVPAPQVTSCAFGGDEMDELFITTAKVGLSKEKLSQYPLSGHVFVAKTSTKGTATNKFHHAKPSL